MRIWEISTYFWKTESERGEMEWERERKLQPNGLHTETLRRNQKYSKELHAQEPEAPDIVEEGTWCQKVGIGWRYEGGVVKIIGKKFIHVLSPSETSLFSAEIK